MRRSPAWAGLGVDVVRIHVLWSRIAPAARATRAPRGFHASDPDDPHYAWTATDAAVDRVRGAGMRVMLTITGPGPLWTSGAPGGASRATDPRPCRSAASPRR